jgi:hypothetical protein
MQSVIWSVLALAALAGMARAADAKDYLTKDGKLRHAVEFRDGQSGFAGVTGTLWLYRPRACAAGGGRRVCTGMPTY